MQSIKGIAKAQIAPTKTINESASTENLVAIFEEFIGAEENNGI